MRTYAWTLDANRLRSIRRGQSASEENSHEQKEAEWSAKPAVRTNERFQESTLPQLIREMFASGFEIDLSCIDSHSYHRVDF